MSNLIVALTLIFLLVLPIAGQSPEWMKLVPLESARADVEKLLGRSEFPNKWIATYSNETGRFMAEYSRGICTVLDGRFSPEKVRNVPEDLLLKLSVRPAHALPLSSYGEDAGALIKIDWPYPDGRKRYRTSDFSTKFETIAPKTGPELVVEIVLYPRQAAVLSCGGEK